MKIVVMGAMGVGKTTIINLFNNSFIDETIQFVEVSFPTATKKSRKFSFKKVDMGIIVIEKNRFSMLFLEDMISRFHEKTPKIIIQMIYRLPSASIEEELSPFFQVIEQHKIECLPLHIYDVEKCEYNEKEYYNILSYLKCMDTK